MEPENNYLIQIDELIRELQEDLEVETVSYRRFIDHFQLLENVIETIKMVTGKNSAESKQVSKTFDNLCMVPKILTKEGWQKKRRKMSKEEKIDSDNSTRSLIITETTMLLNVLKKIKKTHFRSYTQTTSPIQDAEYLLYISKKFTFLQAAGIIISNYISSLLIQLSEMERITYQNDDILHLSDVLINKSANVEMKEFLRKSYRRVENVHDVRNRSAHIDRAKLTNKEVEQAIEFAKLLRKYK